MKQKYDHSKKLSAANIQDGKQLALNFSNHNKILGHAKVHNLCMLKREGWDIYLTHICRHHWRRENLVKS